MITVDRVPVSDSTPETLHGGTSELILLIPLVVAVVLLFAALTGEDWIMKQDSQADLRSKLFGAVKTDEGHKEILHEILTLGERGSHGQGVEGSQEPLLLLKRLQSVVPEIVAVAVWVDSSGQKGPWKRLFFTESGTDSESIPVTRSVVCDSTRTCFPEEFAAKWRGDSVIVLSEIVQGPSGFFRIYCQLFDTKQEKPSAGPQVRCSVYLFDPTKNLLWYLVNLAYLAVILYFTTWLYQKSEAYFLKPFSIGLGMMTATYSARALPGLSIAMGLGALSVWLHNFAEWIYVLVPDAPMFILSAYCLAFEEKAQQNKRWFWIVLAMFYLCNIQLVAHYGGLIFGNTSYFLTPSKMAVWPPVMFAVVTVCLVGVGLFIASVRRINREKGEERTPRLITASVMLALFVIWGVSQVAYLWRDEIPAFGFFFIAKALALSGFVFYGYTARVMADKVRDDNRQETIVNIGLRSLDIILALDSNQRIVWCSARAESLLGPIEENEPLENLVVDERDYRWLIHCLINQQRTLEHFGLILKAKRGHELLCQTDFVPRLQTWEQDILICRPMENLLMTALEKRSHIHGLQGKVNACRAWLQQLVERLREDQNVAIDAYPSVKGLDQNLRSLHSEISPASDDMVELGLREQNYCDLREILGQIKEIALSRAQWDRLATIDIQVPAKSLIVRAKAKKLNEILRELVDNANKVMHKSGSDQFTDLRIAVQHSLLPDTGSIGDDIVDVVVTNTGPPFPQKVIDDFGKPEHMLAPGGKESLHRVKFYARLFGGDISIENEDVQVDGEVIKRPAVHLKLWKAE